MGRNLSDYCRSRQLPEEEKILNIYSVTVQHIIERGGSYILLLLLIVLNSLWDIFHQQCLLAIVCDF